MSVEAGASLVRLVEDNDKAVKAFTQVSILMSYKATMDFVGNGCYFVPSFLGLRVKFHMTESSLRDAKGWVVALTGAVMTFINAGLPEANALIKAGRMSSGSST